MSRLRGRHPDESPDYTKLRDELHQAEVALRDQRERVAELRRRLPEGQRLPDDAFEEVRDGKHQPVRISELFRDQTQPLVLIHFMYGKAQESPCPMCTLWPDGYNATTPHLEQLVNFAVLVAGDAATFESYARGRGWGNLRVVSAADSSLKQTLGFEDPDGGQSPGVSVLRLGAGGAVEHVYSLSADLGPDGYRGMDLLSPFWHLLDLTPEGRGDFFPSKQYEPSR